MKIRIISGLYGQRDGAYGVTVRRPGDPPFEVSDAEGRRLVSLGVAKEIKDRIKKGEPLPVPVDPSPAVTASARDADAAAPVKKAAAKKKTAGTKKKVEA